MATINLGRIVGKSAYEIWLDHGNVGTEEEFLASLEGKDGINGVDGKDGINGVDGKDGINGVDGKDGEPGKDGKTPVKGVDYFTEEDIQELINQVVDSITNGDEVSY